MKMKINVEIHKSGNNNAAILNMVAFHNEEKIFATIADFIGMLKFKQTE